MSSLALFLLHTGAGTGSGAASPTGGGDAASECLRLRVELDTLKHESQTAKVALESQVTGGIYVYIGLSLIGWVVRLRFALEVPLRPIAGVLGLMRNGASDVFQQYH